MIRQCPAGTSLQEVEGGRGLVVCMTPEQVALRQPHPGTPVPAPTESPNRPRALPIIVGAGTGAAAGAGIGKLAFDNTSKGALIGAAVGAIAPLVSESARQAALSIASIPMRLFFGGAGLVMGRTPSSSEMW